MTRKRPVLPHPTDPTIALVELTRGKWAVIDAADAVAVGRFNWSAVWHHGWYARTRHDNAIVSLHRFVASLAGLNLDRLIDHENRNGLDCRRSNLRAATDGQNQQNRRARHDSRSGIKGVRWEPKQSRWLARLTIDGKQVQLGSYLTVEEAASAVALKRREHYGAFAHDGRN